MLARAYAWRNDRLRKRALRGLYDQHRKERSPQGRSIRLLREWLTPDQRAQFAHNGFFDAVGGETGQLYRIYPAASMNVVLLDHRKKESRGLCFLPRGELPVGDVMLAQKLALEQCELEVLTVGRQFSPRGFSIRPPRFPARVLP